MKSCNVWGLTKLLSHIADAQKGVKPWVESADRDQIVPPEGLELYVSALLLQAQYLAKELRLQSTYDRVWDGGGAFYLISNNLTWQQLSNELTVLRQSIEADLEKHLFIQISTEKALMIARMKEDWEQIWTATAGAKKDIEEAIYCYAFERHTASVFHSMRIAEFGIRKIAKTLHVKISDKGNPMPVEFGTWDKVLTAIKNRLGEVRAMPMGHSREKKLQFYSDAADHCLYMKDIWRNTISHTRRPYNDGEALGALNRVQDFMRFLSK